MIAERPFASRASTPALALLVERGIDHRTRAFQHDPTESAFGNEAARQLNADPHQVFKTLIWQADAGFCVAIAPISAAIAPKRLAAALAARRTQLADVSTAERLSGSVVGAISPLGLRQPLRTVLDASALNYEAIMVSAGRRGLEISIAPSDLIELTSAIVAPITSSQRQP
jgi:Cys-tRNA(Pro)/Cys-tRNA(Cys) deacylase